MVSCAKPTDLQSLRKGFAYLTMCRLIRNRGSCGHPTDLGVRKCKPTFQPEKCANAEWTSDHMFAGPCASCAYNSDRPWVEKSLIKRNLFAARPVEPEIQELIEWIEDVEIWEHPAHRPDLQVGYECGRKNVPMRSCVPTHWHYRTVMSQRRLAKQLAGTSVGLTLDSMMPRLMETYKSLMKAGQEWVKQRSAYRWAVKIKDALPRKSTKKRAKRQAVCLM